jgi:hypothetical protein
VTNLCERKLKALTALIGNENFEKHFDEEKDLTTIWPLIAQKSR